MATLMKDQIDFKLNRLHCKLAAINEVLSWATLNENDVNEDFYEDFYSGQFEHVQQLDDSIENQLVDLTMFERQSMSIEFKSIASILRNRRFNILRELADHSKTVSQCQHYWESIENEDDEYCAMCHIWKSQLNVKPQ